MINKSVLVIDSGSCTYVAQYLRKYFQEVKYFNRWAASYPLIGAERMGSGIEGVEKVLAWEDQFKDVDIVFFTDIYFRETANMLIEMGKEVWGSGNMENFERDRALFYNTLSEAGLNVAPTKTIIGIEKLKEYLSDKESVWIKISEYRGVRETWKFVDKRFAEALISELEILLGIYKNIIPIFVQEPVGDMEYGLDPVVSKCSMGANMPIGVEVKDKSYFMRFDKFDLLPNALKECHTKFLDQVKKTDAKDYNGHASTEVRVDKNGNHYLGDFTPRCGIPSSPSMYYGCGNFGEIVEGVVSGAVPDFKPNFKYVVEIAVETQCLDKWNPIYFDDKYKDNIFLSGYAMQDGFTYKCPINQCQAGFDPSLYVGSVCGGGETPDEALKNASEAAHNLEGFKLTFKEPSVKEIYDTISLVEERTGYTF